MQVKEILFTKIQNKAHASLLGTYQIHISAINHYDTQAMKLISELKKP